MHFDDAEPAPSDRKRAVVPEAHRAKNGDMARLEAEHAHAQVRRSSDMKRRKLELWLIGAGVAATLIAAAYQYSGIKNTLESNAAASLYSQQQEIDKIFVEHTDLQPYFWLRKELPRPEASKSPEEKLEAENLAARAEAISYRILDHFAHLKYQMNTQAFDTERADWEAYISQSFERSLVLCRALWADREAFGGTGAQSLWGLYAEPACRDVVQG